MNRIILAFCHDNAELADHIEQSLGRIGIPFELISDRPGDASGSFGARLLGAEDPVLLLLTDNFFKSRDCMSGALEALQSLNRRKQLFTVVADGKLSHDGGASWERVETHFDRMVYALQYMNHWQNSWLALSDQYQHAEGDQKSALEQELNATRNIANEIGEMIGLLREGGYVTWEQFEHDDFALFFRQYGLLEWHTQYRQLARDTYIPQDATPPIPQSAPLRELAETPVFSGGLIPGPAEIDVFAPGNLSETQQEDLHIASEVPEPQNPSTNGHYDSMDALLHDIVEVEEQSAAPDADADFSGMTFELPEEEAADPGVIKTQIDQAVRDAWFWLEKGHVERGLDLLQFTADQHPENEQVRQELAMATARFRPAEPELVEASQPADPSPASQETVAAAAENEAKSYDIMGDMAAEKGDYLFAKYCWDRAAEMNPHYPNIFRKLGLMTSEHLRDYRETALHYLQRALEENPGDGEVHLALAGSILQSEDPAQAEAHYNQAILLDPALRTPENDRLFRPLVAAPQPEPPAPRTTETQPPATAVAAPQIPLEKREVLTVLVTGATSGIGRATAEIFARHGHRVILTGRRMERLVLLKTQFEEELHADVLMLPFDVRDPGSVQAALDNLPESWQNIDMLINNAGLAKGLAPIHEGNLDHWEQMIDTNIKGLLYVTRAVAPGMVARRRGHIVNIGSSAGKEVYANGNVYCATKFAVDALTRAIRLDLHAHNIRVSQVSPGHVEETEFAITRFDGDAERARIYNDFQPLKSSDVAEAIYWMAMRPPHVNIQDIVMFGTQQASATVIDRSGR